MVGVGGILLTCAFMAVRYLTGAYLPGGPYHDLIAPSLRPSFGVIGLSRVLSPSALVLGGMAATAYLVHFSAYDFYSDLEDNSLRRFGLLSAAGFGGTCLISVVMMSLGFLTFGGNSAGLILNNYSSRDAGATACRFVTAVSLIGSYPIFFRGIKSAFLDLFYKDKEITDRFSKTLTKLLLGSLAGLALVLKNAGFTVSFVGAVMGSAIIYVFPPYMYLKSTSRRIRSGALRLSKRVRAERMASRVIIGLGALMGVVGGSVTVMDAFFPRLLSMQ
uniref:Amino acid transporter transmembrane domain-containing protein n=1 Tax=Pseudictyota dubia TaxID=2749911 RepID=A0A7R9VTN1_9STRA|mmetsp:Transcript_21931/g.40897  ORF Transcript_21931/g.40897 Transcript_21931/m.40897 type:complete len:275 (+) Transcript_21931:161-985(+)